MNKRTSFLSSFDFLHVVKNSLFALEIFLGSRKGAAKQQEHTHMCVQTPQFLTPVGISLIFICHTQTQTRDHMYGRLLGRYDRVRSSTAPTHTTRTHTRAISNTFNCSPNYSRFPPPLYCLSLYLQQQYQQRNSFSLLVKRRVIVPSVKRKKSNEKTNKRL